MLNAIISKPSIEALIKEASELGPKVWIGTEVRSDHHFINAYVVVSAFVAVAPGVIVPIMFKKHVGEYYRGGGAEALNKDLKSATAPIEEALQQAGMIIYDGILSKEVIATSH